MWFSASYQVLRYDGHKFRNYPPARGVEVRAVFNMLEVDGEIWLNATPHLLKVDGDSLRRLHFTVHGANQNPFIINTVWFQGKHFAVCDDGLYDLKKNVLTKLIAFRAPDLQGDTRCFIFQDSLLLIHDKTKSELLVINLPQNRLFSPGKKVLHAQQRNGRTYLLEEDNSVSELFQIGFSGDKVDVHSRTLFHTRIPEKIKLFDVDRSGDAFLVDHRNNIFKVNSSNANTGVLPAQGLLNEPLLTLCVDRENNLWAGSLHSVLKIPERLENRYVISDGLPADRVQTIVSLGNDQMVIKTSGGVSALCEGTLKSLTKRDEPFHGQLCWQQDDQYFYHEENKLFSAKFGKRYQVDDEQLVAEFKTNIICAATAGPGQFFVSCHDGLFSVIRNKILKLSADPYKVLFVNNRQQLWAGKFGGELECYDFNNHGNVARPDLVLVVEHALQDVPPVTSIRALAEHPDGELIVGTRYNGLFILKVENNKVVKMLHFDQRAGLKSNHVWGATIDEKGICWIATSAGISSLSRDSGTWAISRDAHRVQSLGAEAILAYQGKIWTNSYPGLHFFDASEVVQHYPFSVFITEVLVNGQARPVDGTHRFKPVENNIMIAFSANTFRFEDEVEYSWRLAEHDLWSPPSKTHELHLSKLKPGRYGFELRGRDAFGRWSENNALMYFSILPPLWQRGWFVGAIGVAMLLVFYSIYQYRSNQAKKLERLRDHIARDLHDEIGSTLSSISILSTVSKVNLARDRPKSAAYLEKIIGQSQQMQQNMRDIIWTIKPDNDRLSDMVSRMREYLAHTLEPLGIAIHFDALDIHTHRRLSMQARRDLFLIFKEAVHNVAKHSGATSVSIRLSQKSEQLLLEVSDDGCGMPPGASAVGNGLMNMKTRAVNLNGTLEMQNGAAGGCLVQLTIPFR